MTFNFKRFSELRDQSKQLTLQGKYLEKLKTKEFNSYLT